MGIQAVEQNRERERERGGSNHTFSNATFKLTHCAYETHIKQTNDESFSSIGRGKELNSVICYKKKNDK